MNFKNLKIEIMENSYGSANLVGKEETKVISREIVDRLASINKFQTDLINQIENKCHSIINLREPEKENASPPIDRGIGDFFSALSSEIDSTNRNNGKLERILYHLQKIV